MWITYKVVYSRPTILLIKPEKAYQLVILTANKTSKKTIKVLIVVQQINYNPKCQQQLRI